MLIVSRQQHKGDPYETLTDECTVIVSAEFGSWHESILAGPPFSGCLTRSNTRWTGRFLAFVAVLMVWESPQTLCDRFRTARDVVTGMFFSSRRVGKTYQGFIKALLRWSDTLLDKIADHTRSVIRQIAGPHWTREQFVAFAVDGSRVECPRTESNETALGCGGRKGTGPQFWLTTLWHMGTGLPWASVTRSAGVTASAWGVWLRYITKTRWKRRSEVAPKSSASTTATSALSPLTSTQLAGCTLLFLRDESWSARAVSIIETILKNSKSGELMPCW